MLAAVAARVAAGDADAPLLVATLAAAPLVALLLTPAARTRVLEGHGAGDVAVLLGLALVLAANLAVLGDVGRLLGLARVHGVIAGIVVALAVVGWYAGDAWWRLAAPVGVAVVIAPLVLVGLSTGTPWATWASLASRPALTFDAHSRWVTDGRVLGERTTLTFSEPHRVVAAAPATWRVIERDTPRTAVREWRLAPGDALTLRPGDQLAVDAGARVRFEAGRRVPGGPSSGMTWADGRARGVRAVVTSALGVAVTLVLGGMMLAPASAFPLVGIATVLVPLAMLSFVVGAALWGLYGMALAPDLSLAPRALGAVFEALARAPAPPRRPALMGIVAVGVLVLLAGVVLAWRVRIAELITTSAGRMQRPAPSTAALGVAGAALVLTAAALALFGIDPWRLFTWGLALVAAAAAAPRLARAGSRGETTGAIVGALLVSVAIAAALVPGLTPWPIPRPFLDHPALMAAPAAFLSARFARTTPSRR